MKQVLLVLAGICLLCFQAHALDETEKAAIPVATPTVAPAKETNTAAIEMANLLFDPEVMDDQEIDEWIWLF
jgi:hypothetical protein